MKDYKINSKIDRKTKIFDNTTIIIIFIITSYVLVELIDSTLNKIL